MSMIWWHTFPVAQSCAITPLYMATQHSFWHPPVSCCTPEWAAMHIVTSWVNLHPLPDLSLLLFYSFALCCHPIKHLHGFLRKSQTVFRGLGLSSLEGSVRTHKCPCPSPLTSACAWTCKECRDGFSKSQSSSWHAQSDPNRAVTPLPGRSSNTLSHYSFPTAIPHLSDETQTL